MLNPIRILLYLAVLLVLCAAGVPALADEDVLTRPGTVAHAIAQPDGTAVYLDDVQVAKIRSHQNPAYFVVREQWQFNSMIVVCIAPSDVLRIGQDVDIEGTLTTLPSGLRAIANARVLGYYDETGALLKNCPEPKRLFDDGTQWQWKAELPAATDTDTAGDPVPGEPNIDPPAPAIAHDSITSLLQNGIFGTEAQLECKRVLGRSSDPVYGDYLLIADDFSLAMVKVYTGAASTTVSALSAETTDGERVNSVTGQVQLVGTEMALVLDGSPVFRSPGLPGNMMIMGAGSTSYAKSLPDGLGASVEDVIVTDYNPATMKGYVQDLNRMSGIRIDCREVGAIDSRAPITIVGMLRTTSDGERELYVTSVMAPSRDPVPVSPLGITNLALGGAALNMFTPGINYPDAATGLSNKGLLVKTTGQVTELNQAAGYFMLHDGSRALSPDGNPGPLTPVKVVWNVEGGPSAVPAVGDYLVCTGISGSEKVDAGLFSRVLRLRFLKKPIITVTAGNEKAELAWTPQDYASYLVYRSTSESCPFSLIATVSGGEFADTGLTNKQTYYYDVRATDSGVVGPAAQVVEVTPTDGKIIPKNPPVSTINLAGTMGNNEWYISPVTVTISATDIDNDYDKSFYKLDDMAAAWSEYASELAVDSNGSHNVAVYSIDMNGNSEDPANPVQSSFKIDSVAPSVSASAATQPNANGWYKSDVTINYTASDVTSGLESPQTAEPGASITFTSVVSTEGADVSNTGSAVDKAGNIGSRQVSHLKIDKTAPSINVTSKPSGNNYIINYDSATVSFTASDSTSGLDGLPWAVIDVIPTNGWASPSSSTVNAVSDGSGGYRVVISPQVVGAYTVKLYAKDKAGNVGQISAPVTFGAGGFTVEWLPPLATMDDYLMEDGSSVPVKFRLLDPANNSVYVNSHLYTVKVMDTTSKVWKTVAAPAPDFANLGYCAVIQTKDAGNVDWPIGDYTVVIEGPGIWDVVSGPYRSRYGLQIVEKAVAKGKGRR